MGLNISIPEAALGLGSKRDQGHPSVTAAACAEHSRQGRAESTPMQGLQVTFPWIIQQTGSALQGGPGSRSR